MAFEIPPEVQWGGGKPDKQAGQQLRAMVWDVWLEVVLLGGAEASTKGRGTAAAWPAKGPICFSSLSGRSCVLDRGAAKLLLLRIEEVTDPCWSVL